jgi:hypothetical protein
MSPRIEAEQCYQEGSDPCVLHGVPIRSTLERARPGHYGLVVRSFVSGYPASLRARKALVVLQAFIDDSASDRSEDKRLVLAGYIHTAEQWALFADEWAAELAKPRWLKSLHMSAGFPGFSRAEKEAKLEALASLIVKFKPVSIECAVSRRDYEELLRPHAPYDLRHPYFPCFVGILNGVAKTLADEGWSGPADIIFDEQGSIGPNAALWYVPIKHGQPDLAAYLGGPPIFRDDEQVLPLQAADLLAWHVRREAEGVMTDHQRMIADTIRVKHRYMEVPREMVAAWGQAFAKVPGIEQAKSPKNSSNRFISKLVSSLPPEHVVPALEEMMRRARWLRLLESIKSRLGLTRLRKHLAKLRARLLGGARRND